MSILKVAQSSTLWPQPANVTLDDTSFAGVAATFAFTATGTAASGSALLKRAFQRYETLLKPAERSVTTPLMTMVSPVTTLAVEVDQAGDTIAFGVDESYTLQWDLAAQQPQQQQTPTLHAKTVFGALRGLETFVQIAENDNVAHAVPLQLPVTAQVSDGPRFS